MADFRFRLPGTQTRGQHIIMQTTLLARLQILKEYVVFVCNVDPDKEKMFTY